jgi:D-sedoheptulose 7-phosphate isomerase
MDLRVKNLALAKVLSVKRYRCKDLATRPLYANVSLRKEELMSLKADPRSKNKTFSMESTAAYLREYASALEATVTSVKPERLDAAMELLEKTLKAGKRIYVCGNGGSAAIADHLCCDWTKGTRITGKPALKTHSLVANGALLTALANDYGYDQTFSTQVDIYGEPGDVLVAISSSGNSPNIINALEAAKARGMKVIGLSGFSGGKLAEQSDVSLHAAFDNYGLVEDCHQVLMHVLSQVLLRRMEARS